MIQLNGSRTLIVAAHPDDLEINAGGLVARLVEDGHQVHAFIATLHQNHERETETKASFECLGISEYHAGCFIDTNIIAALPTVVKDIDKLIDKWQIDTLITHHHADSHQDHWAVSKAAQASARKVRNLIYFQPTYPSGRVDIPFNPNMIVKLEDRHLEIKLKSLACHTSQAKKYGEEEWYQSIKDIVKADAWKLGGFHGCAELFEVSRILL